MTLQPCRQRCIFVFARPDQQRARAHIRTCTSSQFACSGRLVWTGQRLRYDGCFCTTSVCVYVHVRGISSQAAMLQTTLVLGFRPMRSLGHNVGPAQLYFPMFKAKAQKKNKCREQAITSATHRQALLRSPVSEINDNDGNPVLAQHLHTSFHVLSNACCTQAPYHHRGRLYD